MKDTTETLNEVENVSTEDEKVESSILNSIKKLLGIDQKKRSGCMTFDKSTKTISINRGDRGTIKLINTHGNFKVGDKIKFSIIEKDNYESIVFQKIYTVIEESSEFYLTLTKEDTRIGDIISKEVIYYYEIEYNGDQTLIGYDKKKNKKFILFPEAANKEGSA